jgi:hypothetical protein
MAGYDYEGRVIPWYESPIIRGYNYTWEKKPEAPPIEEVKQYLENQAYVQSKRSEGNSGFGGFLDKYVNPILDPMAADPLKTAAIFAATATGNAYLVPYIVGADTAIAGGSPEDVLKSAAKAYVGQQIGTAIGGAIGGDGFTGVTETGLPTLASESVAADLAGATLLGDAGSTGAYESAIDSFPTPIDQTVVTPDVLTLPTDDATRLAQLIREFENPTELTGSTIDVASNPTVELGNATVDESLGLPNVPKDLQNEAYLDPGLIDVAPENVTIGTPEPTFNGIDLGGTDIGQIGGGIIGSNIGGGTSIDGTGVKPNLSAGELTVSGTPNTFDPWDNPESLPTIAENLPVQEPVKPDTTAKANSIKLGNLLKSSLQQSALTQQQSNISNALRGSQIPTMIPSIYKQQNPFNFGQQVSPVQDTNALAKLLRTA